MQIIASLKQAAYSAQTGLALLPTLAQVRLRVVDGSTRAAACFGDADLQLAIPDAPARLYLPGLADEDGGDLVVRR